MVLSRLAWNARAAGRVLSFNVHYALRSRYVRYAPLVVNLEPTNHCNLRCPMCPVSQQEHNPGVARGFMSETLMNKLVGELAEFRPLVALNLGGESTLHKQLPAFVRALKGAGCYVFLDTNATRLDRAMSEALCDSGLDEIVLCLDGDGDAESYERMRVRGRLDDTVANIRAFLAVRAARGAGPRTIVKNIHFYQDGAPLEFPPQLTAMFSEQPPDELRATYADYWPGNHRSLLRRRYPVEPYAKSAYTACTNLWKKLAISWDGMIYACCLDLNRTTPIGNATEVRLLDIWNSEAMMELRTIHAEGRQAELSLCRECTMIRRAPASRLSGLLRPRQERFLRLNDRRRPATGEATPRRPS